MELTAMLSVVFSNKLLPLGVTYVKKHKCGVHFRHVFSKSARSSFLKTTSFIISIFSKCQLEATTNVLPEPFLKIAN
jgi:hypothetical protein